MGGRGGGGGRANLGHKKASCLHEHAEGRGAWGHALLRKIFLSLEIASEAVFESYL